VGSADAAVRQQGSEAEVLVPFSFTVVPGLSTQGPTSRNVVNNLSIGFIATHAARLDGLAMALGGNWVDRGASGAQLAVGGNIAGGEVRGLQLATGLNVAGAGLAGLQGSVGFNVLRGDLLGGQLTTGFNVVSGRAEGLQGAVGLNIARGDLVGAQLAVGVNLAAGNVRGLQASAGLNVAPRDMVGVQASSGISYAGRIEGAQLSLLNVGGDVNGAQVGLVNVARQVRGLQLGLVNVASQAEGASVGLLNFIGNGQLHLQAWASDVALTNVALKFGGKYTHTLLTVGVQPGTDVNRRHFVLGVGLGGHIPLDRFFLDIDAIASSLHATRLFSSSDSLLAQLRLVGGFHVAPRFAVIAGVTGNTLVSTRSDPWTALGTGSSVEWERVKGETRVRVWPGVLLGVQL
jgi:hypothetical protein